LADGIEEPVRSDGAGFERRGRGAFLFLGFALIFLTSVLLWAAQQSRSDAAWVDHTREVISVVGQVDLALTRAESAARALLLNRDESWRNEFGENRAEAAAAAQRLHELVVDNPSQAERVDRLNGIVNARLVFLERNLDRFRTGESIESIAEDTRDQAKILIGDLKTELGAMRREEEQLLAGRVAARRQTNSILIVLCMGVMLASLAVAVRGDHMIRKYSGMRDRAEERLRSANEQLENRVRERTRELERSNDDLRQFAFAASHDLNEPLRTIGIYSDLLRQRHLSKLDDEAAQVLGFILKGVARMEALLGGLRTYMQVSAVPRDAAPLVNLRSGLDAALLDLKAVLDESGASVRCDGLPSVHMHAIHAHQIFQNLIGNAVKYRSADPPQICISSENGGKEWVVRVRDNGIGIDSQYQTQIFGLFKRLHPSHEIPGSGLGLAICRTIVQSYGGRIWVESEQGKGSTFSFALPREK